VDFSRFRPPSPGRRSARRGDPATTLVEGFGPVPDDHPRDVFFTSPLRVTDLRTTVEDHPAGVRVSFLATVKDAEGRRCPDVAVHARVRGPERAATGMGHTSMMGGVTFRMSGPAGSYTCVIEDVAGGALGLDLDASVVRATVDAEARD
jgi:hypothetical protein